MTDGQSQNAGGSNFGVTASNAWGAKSEHGSRRDKEELVDVLMAEQLRKGQSAMIAGLMILNVTDVVCSYFRIWRSVLGDSD
jgi:hypothetical protein